MNRLNRILVVLLVVQLAVAAVVLWPRPAATGEGESLFAGVEAGRIVRLTISSGDGHSVELAKRDGQWVLPAADDYPIAEDKVSPLLNKIAGLKTGRPVAQTSASQNRLKVADDTFERLVEFELDDGTQHRLYLGTSPSYQATHIRAAGQDEVYLITDLSAQDAGAEASAWVDRTYLELPSDQIVALTLENENGRLEFKKDGQAWTMVGLADGESLDEASVTTLANRAALVTLLEPLGKEEKAEYGLGKPSAVVTIETQGEDGTAKTYTLRVGAKDPVANSYVLISSESPYYVRVTQTAVEDFVSKNREAFLKLPLTPTPAPAVMPGATPTSP